jgi:hypothetical protein
MCHSSAVEAQCFLARNSPVRLSRCCAGNEFAEQVELQLKRSVKAGI